MQAERSIQLGPESLKNSVVQYLHKLGLPVTRENYLDVAGLEEPLDAEIEAGLPPELRKNWEEPNSSGTVRPEKRQQGNSTPSVKTTKSGFRLVDITKPGRGLTISGLRQSKSQ